MSTENIKEYRETAATAGRLKRFVIWFFINSRAIWLGAAPSVFMDVTITDALWWKFVCCFWVADVLCFIGKKTERTQEVILGR